MSWRSFGAGLLSGLLLVAVAITVVFLRLSSPAGDATAEPSSRPTTSLTSSTGITRPQSVEPGDTWLGDVDLSSSDVLTADGPLRDVTAVGSGVSLTDEGLAARRLEITAILPFDTAAAQMGEDVELYAAGDLAGMRRTARVLGRDIEIDATGRVSAVDGRLVIEPQTIDLGSFDWMNRIASSLVRSFVTFEHTVTGIPGDMRLDSVAVHPDGFAVDLSGAGVRIG